MTGVAGFIGSSLAQRLVAEGFLVIGIDDLSKGKVDRIPKEVDFYSADLARGDLSFLPPTIDVVCHLAGQSSSERSFMDPVDDLRRNGLASLEFLKAVATRQIGAFLYASSMAVYGNPGQPSVSEHHEAKPISPYGLSKLFFESAVSVLQPAFPTLGFRMFNVYGPGQDLADLNQGMVSIYLAQALESGHISVKGSMDRVRDFIFLDDVVEAWTRAALSIALTQGVNDGLPSVLNLGTGVPSSISTVISEIALHFQGLTASVEPPTRGDPAGFVADMTEFSKHFGHLATLPLPTGIRRTVLAEV